MKEQLFNTSHPDFRHLLGTRVEFICKGRRMVGIADFIGINTNLHNQFQVTSDRCPQWPVDPNTIKECPRQKPIFQWYKKS